MGTSGYYDIPFFYVLNYFFPKTGPGANPLIDSGTGFASQAWADVIPSQGDYEFRLRRHIPSWPRNFNLLDAGSYSLYSPLDLNPFPNNTANIRADLLVSPDLVYPPGAGIRVANTNGFQFSTGPDNYWYGFYAMQGVKRIYKAPNTAPNYPYYERSFTYPLKFTLNTQFPSFQTAIVLVNNYDFELQAIEFFENYGTSTTNEPTVMGIKVYDSARYSMMSDFVDISLLQTGNSNTKPGPAGCFPTPPVIYPRGSQITVDIQGTQLSANLPQVQYINFVGVNRIPCSST